MREAKKKKGERWAEPRMTFREYDGLTPYRSALLPVLHEVLVLFIC